MKWLEKPYGATVRARWRGVPAVDVVSASRAQVPVVPSIRLRRGVAWGGGALAALLLTACNPTPTTTVTYASNDPSFPVTHWYGVMWHVEDAAGLSPRDAMLAAGWRLMRMYPPVSPVLPLAVWLRCPAWCCPVEEEQ